MAKGLTLSKIARKIILFCNVCFVCMGIAILIFAIIGYLHARDLKDNTDITSSLDLTLLSIIVIVAGGATTFIGIIGYIGSLKRNVLVLKIYVLFCLIVLIVQIVIAIYLLSLSMDKLRLSWEENSESGWERRKQIQNYLSCCGFDEWSDSLGTLHTNCFKPDGPFYNDQVLAYPDYIEPETCKQKLLDFIAKWITPMAVAAIVIASVEGLTVIMSLILIFDPKSRAAEFTG